MDNKAHKPLDKHFPAWHYGPKGEAEIFHSEDDIPKGWHDHPAKHSTPAKVADEKAKLNQGKADESTGTSTETGAGGTTSFAPGGENEIDTDGHHWSAGLHAATRSKTNDGRWRMKVGVSRPAPVEGYPKPDAPREAAKAAGTPALDL